MAKDKDLEDFLRQWVEPPPKAKRPAAEIMLAGPLRCSGPRREDTRTGSSRWVVKLGSRPNLKHSRKNYPAL